MLNHNLICPVCQKKIIKKRGRFLCSSCQKKYPIKNKIPIILPSIEDNKTLYDSQKQYERHFTTQGFKIPDASYEILASFAKGNKTLDVGCGEGWIEKLAPKTIGLDFSFKALLRAKKNGAKHLICASAEYLPFRDNSFDLAISAGGLEHFVDPQKALSEMARVTKIQALTVHRELPFPFSRQLRKLFFKFKKVPGQYIDNPFYWPELASMFEKANLKIIFHGLWNFPAALELVHPILLKIAPFSSCFFIVSVKRG